MDKIENDDFSAQLRCLRLLLGRNFKPISTAALAKFTEIPYVSIRGVEAGRRVLNDADRFAVDIKLGAVWDPQSHQWLAVWQEEKGVPLPFSRATYERYSEVLINSRSLAESNINRLTNALLKLTDALEPKDVTQVLLTVHHIILNIAKQKKVAREVIKSLEELCPELNFNRGTVKRLYLSDLPRFYLHSSDNQLHLLFGIPLKKTTGKRIPQQS